jgi:hypothetical protein
MSSSPNANQQAADGRQSEFGKVQYDGTIDNGPVGIGGWLITAGVLFVLGMTLGSIRVWKTAFALVAHPELLDFNGTASYSTGYRIFILVHTLAIGIIGIGSAAALYMMLTKARAFPVVATVLALFVAATFVGYALLGPGVYLKMSKPMEFDQSITYAIMLLIWARYFSVSKRVRNTFGAHTAQAATAPK